MTVGNHFGDLPTRSTVTERCFETQPAKDTFTLKNSHAIFYERCCVQLLVRTKFQIAFSVAFNLVVQS
jgi:hypothetical protein